MSTRAMIRTRGFWLLCSLAAACDFGPGAREAIADDEIVYPEVAGNVPMLEHPERPVVSYTLRAKLEPVAHTVHGEGTLRWTNTSTKPVSELWFHLYLNGFKNQSSVFMRAPVGGFRGNTTPHEWGTIDVARLSLALSCSAPTMSGVACFGTGRERGCFPLRSPRSPGLSRSVRACALSGSYRERSLRTCDIGPRLPVCAPFAGPRRRCVTR